MKKLMIFLLCFLLTGCAAPQAGGSESSGSSGSAPSGSVSSPQVLPPGGGRILSDARPGRLPGGEPLSL